VRRCRRAWLSDDAWLCDAALQVVGVARSDALNHTLIDYLMGETDGVPKDPNYIFKLYFALGNFVQVSCLAVLHVAHS
jgi:WD repeat-containing protein 19